MTGKGGAGMTRKGGVRGGGAVVPMEVRVALGAVRVEIPAASAGMTDPGRGRDGGRARVRWKWGVGVGPEMTEVGVAAGEGVVRCGGG